MTIHAVLSDVFYAALPSVQAQPLRAMPKQLYSYIVKVSGKQQVRLCLLTVLIFPLTLAPLELQRRIVDGAVAGADTDLLFLFGGLYFAAVITQGGVKI